MGSCLPAQLVAAQGAGGRSDSRAGSQLSRRRLRSLQTLRLPLGAPRPRKLFVAGVWAQHSWEHRGRPPAKPGVLPVQGKASTLGDTVVRLTVAQSGGAGLAWQRPDGKGRRAFLCQTLRLLSFSSH